MQWPTLLKKSLFCSSEVVSLPGSLLNRDRFVKVDLARILQEPSDHVEMYLVFEKGENENYECLRIHTRLKSTPTNKYFWYQKRLPSSLERSDLIPCFRAFVNRLPKRSRPLDLTPWEAILSSSALHLNQKHSERNNIVSEQSHITLVFGSIAKLDRRPLFHLDRKTIQFFRLAKRLTIFSTQSGIYGLEMWKFHLLMESKAAAINVEQEMLAGEKIHFSVDRDTIGMIACSAGFIDAINVPIETVQELCLTEGEALSLRSRPRDKLKLFGIVPKDIVNQSP